MAWQTCVDVMRTTDPKHPKTLSIVAYETKQAGFVPIVLRLRRASITMFDFNGLEASELVRDVKHDGSLVISGQLNPNYRTTFFKDELNVGYAIVPNSERNMKTLTACQTDKNCLWEVEEPLEIKQKIEADAKELLKRSAEVVKAVGIKKTEEVAVPEEPQETVKRKPGRPKVQKPEVKPEVEQTISDLLGATA